MNELLGVAAAMLSGGLGGTAVGATRYLVGAVDPWTLGALRFGVGFGCLLPIALLQGGSWPARRDWPRVAALGVLFFAIFPILFNLALVHTTAARGALALSTLPVLTMAVAAVLRVEALTRRKTAGVAIAMVGVGIALLSGLASAPPDAWRGDLLMLAAALCMALYSIWSRPLVRRSGALPFTTLAMAVGAACLAALSGSRGGFAAVARFGTPQWLAIGWLGLFGSALTFFLWGFALGRTTPTKVSIAVTVNPVTASLVGAVLLGEPIRWNLVLGLATVFLGIWVATREDVSSQRRSSTSSPIKPPM